MHVIALHQNIAVGIIVAGAAARRRFDVVVVWRFDRFARSVSHLLRALEQFQALGSHQRDESLF
jgi:DNA invertase Pin-like site-specific DNA recombinase